MGILSFIIELLQRCIERVNEKRKRERQNRFEKRFRWIVDDIPECHEDDGDSKDEIIREVMSSIFNDCKSETDFETFVNDYESYIQELHYELYNDLGMIFKLKLFD